MDDERPVTIWERAEHPQSLLRAARGGLSHEQIARAAVEIADRDGLDAVSMRRLATHLGMATMALYRYVDTKDDIFWLMVDVTLERVPIGAEDERDWRGVVTAHAVRSRTVILQHPWLIELAARVSTGLTPRRMAVAEDVLRSLARLGIEPDDRLTVLTIVNSFVWGATGTEVAQARLMQRQGWRSGDDLRSALSPQMAWLMGTGRFPTYHDTILEAKRKDDDEWRFVFGLDCLLDGIAARLEI
jgi:AcrR family transcriptional regulator